MKKVWKQLVDNVLPRALGVMWFITITALSVGAVIWSIKWVLRLVEVL